MPIIIPADLTIVTLRNNGTNQPQRFTESYAANLLGLASSIWQDRAEIGFRRNSCQSVVEEMPAGMHADVLDESGYHFLVSRYRAGLGVRVLFVDRTVRPELGGQARHQTRVCLIKYEQNPGAASRMLAHELGHLLELPHIDDRSVSGPGSEATRAPWLRNLMFSGALTPNAEINDDQKRQARLSALARQFGGG
jgi:hypothetical protein